MILPSAWVMSALGYMPYVPSAPRSSVVFRIGWTRRRSANDFNRPRAFWGFRAQQIPWLGHPTSMSIIDFWEKPGCAGNARQRALLERAGHRLRVYSLLSGTLTREDLVAFFGQLPVREWFNRNAPAIKNGIIDPEAQTPESALRLMLEQPILIRRPLMVVNGVRLVGFDVPALEAIVGRLPETTITLDGCVHVDNPAEDSCSQ